MVTPRSDVEAIFGHLIAGYILANASPMEFLPVRRAWSEDRLLRQRRFAPEEGVTRHP